MYKKYEKGQPGNRDAIMGTLLNPKNVLSTWEGGQWGTDVSKVGQPYGKCLPKDTDHLARGFPCKNAVNLFEIVAIINHTRKILKQKNKSGESTPCPTQRRFSLTGS
jgi:hypothetical protein